MPKPMHSDGEQQLENILDEMYQIHTCDYAAFGALIKKAYAASHSHLIEEVEKMPVFTVKNRYFEASPHSEDVLTKVETTEYLKKSDLISLLKRKGV